MSTSTGIKPVCSFQLGLLDPNGLPIAGAETARKVLDVSLPSNTLMKPWQ
jgi:carboxymethylenebutenolidase